MARRKRSRICVYWLAALALMGLACNSREKQGLEMGDGKKPSEASKPPASPVTPPAPGSLDLPPVADDYGGAGGQDEEPPPPEDDPATLPPASSDRNDTDDAATDDAGDDSAAEVPGETSSQDPGGATPDPGQDSELPAPSQEQQSASGGKSPLDVDPFAKQPSQAQSSPDPANQNTQAGQNNGQQNQGQGNQQSQGNQWSQAGNRRHGLAGILAAYLGSEVGDLTDAIINMVEAQRGGGQMAGSQGLTVNETQVEVPK